MVSPRVVIPSKSSLYRISNCLQNLGAVAAGIVETAIVVVALLLLLLLLLLLVVATATASPKSSSSDVAASFSHK